MISYIVFFVISMTHSNERDFEILMFLIMVSHGPEKKVNRKVLLDSVVVEQ